MNVSRLIPFLFWDHPGFPKERNEYKRRELFDMETIFYVVDSIDGDYANLRRTDVEEEELKLVARALLPEEIGEGTRLKYEFLQYDIL